MLGHKLTEKILKALESSLKSIYMNVMDKTTEILYRFLGSLNLKADTRKSLIEARKYNKLQKCVNSIMSYIYSANKKVEKIILIKRFEAFGLNYSYASFLVEQLIDANIKFNTVPKETIKSILESGDYFTKISTADLKSKDGTLKRLERELVIGILKGETIPKIAERITGVINTSKEQSIRIARTEITRGQNEGRYNSFLNMKKQGITIKKQWISTIDNRTRLRHRKVNGEVTAVEQRFSNGLLFPGDPSSGEAKEVINCRCTISSIIGSKTPEEVELDNRLNEKAFNKWREKNE